MPVMNLARPSDVLSILKNITIVQEQIPEFYRLHSEKLEAFIERFGKPEKIASKNKDKPLIKKLAKRAQEYYATVNSAFKVCSHSFQQLVQSSHMQNANRIEDILKQAEVENGYHFYMQSKERLDILKVQVEKSNQANNGSRSLLLKAEADILEKFLKTFSPEEIFVFNYFEVVAQMQTVLEQLDEFTLDLENIEKFLADSNRLTFKDVIKATKQKKKERDTKDGLDSKGTDSWSKFYNQANSGEFVAKFSQLVSAQTDLTIIPEESGEDWDAELAIEDTLKGVLVPGFQKLKIQESESHARQNDDSDLKEQKHTSFGIFD